MPAAQLACLLEDTAAGIAADDAAVTLIARHGHFLHQPGFRRIIAAGSSIYSGQPVAVIRWRAAVHALDTGLLPSSSSEQAILRIAASLGDPAIPVHGLFGSAAHNEAVARLRWLISAIGNPRYQNVLNDPCARPSRRRQRVSRSPVRPRLRRC